MKKKIIISTVIIAAIVGIICFLIFKDNNVKNINADSIIESSEGTGFIAEKIVGDPDEAKVIIYEYADFACSHCAEWNKKINSLMEKYDGKIALVFRSYNLGFQNSSMAARAATAAQIQGYFKEYKDLLFAKQVEWFYEEGAKLNEILVEYFKDASNDSGDIDKFQEDMKSSAVKTRLKFEQNLGKRIGLAGTPTFRIDGKTIDLSELEKTIEQKANQ